MIEAGEVGVIFNVRNESTASLEAIAKQFTAIQTSIDNIEKAVAGIFGPGGSLSKLELAFGPAVTATEDASKE